jgi:hypothetical protein
MWEYVNSVFMQFSGCFSRKVAFHCFIIVVMGFMLRCDNAGISSIIRTLALLPVKYESLVHFFVPALGNSRFSRNNGYVLSDLPAFCSLKMGCLFLSETG